jgi:hypothetical protein
MRTCACIQVGQVVCKRMYGKPDTRVSKGAYIWAINRGFWKAILLKYQHIYRLKKSSYLS